VLECCRAACHPSGNAIHSRKEVVAPPSSSSLKGRRETSAGRTHVLTLAPLDLATNIIPGHRKHPRQRRGTTVTTARVAAGCPRRIGFPQFVIRSMNQDSLFSRSYNHPSSTPKIMIKGRYGTCTTIRQHYNVHVACHHQRLGSFASATLRTTHFLLVSDPIVLEEELGVVFRMRETVVWSIVM
jgi:hypothetical protein